MRGTIFELLKVGDFSHYSFQKYNSHSGKYDGESGCMRALLAAQSPERIPADITTKNPYSPIGVQQYTSERRGREFPEWMDGWGSKESFNLPHYLKYYQSRCVHSKYGPKNGQVFFSRKNPILPQSLQIMYIKSFGFFSFGIFFWKNKKLRQTNFQCSILDKMVQ